MSKVPDSTTKEQYLLKSSFFYNKLKTNGYFELFMKIQAFDSIEGDKLITSSDSNKRKFVNRLRVIMKLAKSSI